MAYDIPKSKGKIVTLNTLDPCEPFWQFFGLVLFLSDYSTTVQINEDASQFVNFLLFFFWLDPWIGFNYQQD